MGQGLGAFIWGDGENMSFGHPGDNYPGASFWLMGYPALGKGVGIMPNSSNHSCLRLSTGLALAALKVWRLTVIRATVRPSAAERRSTHISMSIR
jgi:hypothetical protein